MKKTIVFFAIFTMQSILILVRSQSVTLGSSGFIARNVWDKIEFYERKDIQQNNGWLLTVGLAFKKIRIDIGYGQYQQTWVDNLTEKNMPSWFFKRVEYSAKLRSYPLIFNLNFLKFNRLFVDCIIGIEIGQWISTDITGLKNNSIVERANYDKHTFKNSIALMQGLKIGYR